MSYTVLARKYRSATFGEVVGQEPIATTLVNAINAGRIHHGYLFTGTRGVGKTSMARILAKALNCLKSDGPTAKPCLKCDSCVSIAEGQDIDVVEIDAASNTGVDNIRELRSNAAYRPARARHKIYIIDEVHMLSTGAFNALLKTLEEPPPHVKFILATTEIQKVPATILSRCQCFNFRNISPDQIAEQLAKVAKDEGAETETAVIRRVARLANGSMRDGLSILDQLLSLSPKKLNAELLDEVLPPAQDERIFGMLRAAAAGDAAAVLKTVEEALSQGRTIETFCNDMIEVVHTLMLLRTCGPDSSLIDIPAGGREEYAALAAHFELSQYVQMIAMLEELRRQVHYSGAARSLVDATLVRIARMKQWAAIEDLIAGLPGRSAAPIGSPAANRAPAPHSGPSPAAPADEKKKTEPGIAPVSRPAASAETPASRQIRTAPTPSETGVPQSARRLAVPAHAVGGDAAAPGAAGGDRPMSASPDRSPTGASPREATTPPRIPVTVTAEDKARIMRDPVVQRAVDLFSGRLVNIERRQPAADAESEVHRE